MGDFLELVGSVSLYAESGRYQFIASSMKKSGNGRFRGSISSIKRALAKRRIV